MGTIDQTPEKASAAETGSAPNPLAEDFDMIVGHTGELWEELRGRRLFITGGTGFFGCWLLESFARANDMLDLGAEAVVLSRRPAAFQRKAPHLAGHPAVRLVEGDVRNFAFPAGEFSHVIHAATESSWALNEDDPLQMLDTIAEGTRRALDFAVACQAQKFLLTSSGAVYGRQPADMTHIPEDYTGGPDTMDPRSAYGEGKRAAEISGAVYAKKHGLAFKIARCFAFVGPNLPLDIHFAIGNFIRDALAGGPIVVKGDGTPRRSYLYAADLAIWLWTILSSGASCRPYNVGSDEDVSIGEVARIVAGKTGLEHAVRISGIPTPGQSPLRYVPSVERARQELGLTARIDLGDAVQRTLDFVSFQQRVLKRPLS